MNIKIGYLEIDSRFFLTFYILYRIMNIKHIRETFNKLYVGENKNELHREI